MRQFVGSQTCVLFSAQYILAGRGVQHYGKWSPQIIRVSIGMKIIKSFVTIVDLKSAIRFLYH